jgi:hypothetical protein
MKTWTKGALMEDPARNYDLGLAYLAAAKRMLVAARRLETEDKELVRRLADGFVGKGTTLLTRAVKQPRRGRQSAPAEPGNQG